MADRPRVAFQGEPGAFSEEAALTFFASPDVVAHPAWRSVFEAVRDGSVDAGVIAIESSLAGTIRETYDLLFEFDLRIVGEVTVPVRLALMALPGQTVEQIERVYSHPQALAQADAFLRTRPWNVEATYNTAGAARTIVASGDRGAAAIASERVAGLYGLQVLVSNVQSGDENRTRFAVLARPEGALPADWFRETDGRPRKSTIVFATPNVPGSLYRCLGVFARRGINISQLESRPSRAARWEYVFWADLDVDADSAEAREAFAELRGETAMLRVLGTYPKAAEA
ncbi:MAG: prephenate dehydratase [Chloroflexi bacterium]|nr:prephenate dehydratase [Chloroflexota bacterium]